MKQITDIKRAERAAATTTPAQLPEHLRAPAAKLLGEYGKALTAEGHAPAVVAVNVAHLLLTLAFYLPDECPDLADVHGDNPNGWWPWEANAERRFDLAAVADGRFGHARLLWAIANGNADERAEARRDLDEPGWRYRVAEEQETAPGRRGNKKAR